MEAYILHIHTEYSNPAYKNTDYYAAWLTYDQALIAVGKYFDNRWLDVDYEIRKTIQALVDNKSFQEMMNLINYLYKYLSFPEDDMLHTKFKINISKSTFSGSPLD